MNTTRKAPPRKSAARKVAAPKAPRQKAAPAVAAVLPIVEAALENMKAVDVQVLDVRGISDVADFMVIASGTSDRHLRAVADRVVQMAKASGFRPLGVEGEEQGEWVLVDLPDVMVHIMLPRTREFYQLEQLWESVKPVKPVKSVKPDKPAKPKPAKPAARTRPRAPRARQ